MDIRKTVSAVIVATMVLSMTACANSEKPSGNGGGTMQTGSNSTNNSIPLIQDKEKEPTKELGIWDVLPKIPVTDASAFTYKYDSELGGMVVTDYLRESPKVRIPDTLEGEPVVKVDFIDCQKELTELIMPDSVKSFRISYTIRDTLQYANVPQGMTEILGHFYGCENLTDVYIHNNVIYITDEYNDRAFGLCESLTNAVYRGKSYDFEHIGCLYDAINLGESGMLIQDGILKDVSREFTELNIPDNVTEISSNAFKGCTNLTSLTLPNSITEIRKAGVFADCTNLTNINIPDTVTEINGDAFRETMGVISISDGERSTVIVSCCEKIQATYKGKTYDYEHIEDLCKVINGN